ncbi:antA/AntB antirepressor family protein [Orbaceae bacterium ESL0721]|nr:antA/AntB antirepressor family protein [Orbaceae bacterium ESL0721]
MSDFNNVVPVTETTINGKAQQTVSAKQLHSCLNVGRDFSTWINNRIEQYGFIDNDDYIVFNSPKRGNQDGEKRHGGDRKSKDYYLTLNMAKELAMIENNDQGHAIRRYFIRCEEQLRNIAPTIHKSELKRLKARLEAASYTRPMCDALTLSRLTQGKETKPHHYKNEYDMLNSIVLGMPAKGYRKTHGLTGEIRDHFNEKQISHLSYLERSNITLLELGWDYQQRKAELTKLSQIYLSRQMDGVSQ